MDIYQSGGDLASPFVNAIIEAQKLLLELGHSERIVDAVDVGLPQILALPMAC